MKVFAHHLYEYRKGLRNLILHTTLAQHRPQIEARLVKHGVDYVVYPLSNGRINVFFGAEECVEVIRRIGKDRLNDYTLEEDFMLGIMLGYDRLVQCRRYLLRHERQHDLPLGARHGVWPPPAPAPAGPPTPPAVRAGFTLIELLIVIGLLGALATLLLSTYSVNRTETLNDSIVQKELADIQAAFQRLEADCVLREEDYALVSRHGLAVLTTPGLLPSWDADRNRGWRGPYIVAEASRQINLGGSGISTVGQAPVAGGQEVSVVCTPQAKGGNDGHFYRVAPELDGGRIEQLWVVFPGDSGMMTGVPDVNSSDPAERDAFEQYPYKRRLLLRN